MADMTTELLKTEGARLCACGNLIRTYLKKKYDLCSYCRYKKIRFMRTEQQKNRRSLLERYIKGAL